MKGKEARMLAASIDLTLAEVDALLRQRREPTCDVRGCWNVAVAFDMDAVKFVCGEHQGKKQGGGRDAKP